jgi:hypothetical protein
MKLLARADNTLQASIWADTLRAAGIRCELRNTALSGALGEIPFLECAPQLWIERDHDEPRAREILQQLERRCRDRIGDAPNAASIQSRNSVVAGSAARCDLSRRKDSRG